MFSVQNREVTHKSADTAAAYNTARAGRTISNLGAVNDVARNTKGIVLSCTLVD